MIYIVTLIGIILIFLIEYLIQKNESKSVFKFFKSVSLYKTIEQILIVILSASTAILFANAAEKSQVKKQYQGLLRNAYIELFVEEDFLNKYLNDDPSSDYLDTASDELFKDLLRAVDRSVMMENVFNTNEAPLTLSPAIYSEIVYQIGIRKFTLDDIYSGNLETYGDRDSALAFLDHTDKRLLFLFRSEIEVLANRGNAEGFMEEYNNTFSYSLDSLNLKKQ